MCFTHAEQLQTRLDAIQNVIPRDVTDVKQSKNDLGEPQETQTDPLGLLWVDCKITQ